MAKVRISGKEVEGQAIVTEAQAKALEHWQAAKSPEAKSEEAAYRQAERGKRTAKQQLAELDRRLGKDVGAARERARLTALAA